MTTSRQDESTNPDLLSDPEKPDEVETDPLATLPAAAVTNPILAGAFGAVVAQYELAHE